MTLSLPLSFCLSLLALTHFYCNNYPANALRLWTRSRCSWSSSTAFRAARFGAALRHCMSAPYCGTVLRHRISVRSSPPTTRIRSLAAQHASNFAHRRSGVGGVFETTASSSASSRCWLCRATLVALGERATFCGHPFVCGVKTIRATLTAPTITLR